ncbi:hypothetical protein A3K73_01910 [Candidatus Pacearchaeota archaeon RBG_13_36_9]|nr:MAG: hypothetical protein A3K73_01910 [Candidatus Pacearchaeota archaeon RBG_13_36_9]
MSLQRTIKERIKMEGIDLPSGNPSRVFLYPAPPDTGIVFETPVEQIVACLDNTSAMTFPCKTLVLHGKKSRIAVPEHILAPLYAFGADNVYVKIEKTPSLTSRLFHYLGSARNTYFMPHFGKELCEALESNLQEQGKNRRKLRLEEEIRTDKLVITSNETSDLRIYAQTDYKLAAGVHVRQKKEIIVSPESIKEISTARNYCGTFSWAPKWLTKTIACFAFLSHGFGNGNDETNVFYPSRTRERWYAQEQMQAEIACHTVLDRLGELALFQGELCGISLYCYGAGHKYAIETLKKHQNKFKVVEN